MRFTAVAMALSLAGALVVAAPCAVAQNLIVNGNAEAGVGSTTGGSVTVPGWNVTSGLTVVKYGTSGGFPLASDTGPQNRGNNFFAGGVDTAASRAIQVIDLVAYSGAINSGTSQFDLSGWMGGYATQSDSATLTAVFRNSAGKTLFSHSLAPVSASDRGGATGMVYRESRGLIPVGAALVDIVLDMTRVEGSYNDGYADNLSFSLVGASIAAVPEPSTWGMLAAGLAVLGVASRKRRASASSNASLS